MTDVIIAYCLTPGLQQVPDRARVHEPGSLSGVFEIAGKTAIRIDRAPAALGREIQGP
jgi:hypothetical protein